MKIDSLCQDSFRKPHTLVCGRILSTRELLNIAILCAAKSIKDFACIQTSRMLTLAFLMAFKVQRTLMSPKQNARTF